jgi:hypothetical protein
MIQKKPKLYKENYDTNNFNCQLSYVCNLTFMFQHVHFDHDSK